MVVIRITPDSWPTETSWQLSMSGTLLASGLSTGATVPVCGIAGSSLNFTMIDSYGDGICCIGTTPGSYSVTLNGAQVASGAQFKYRDTTVFPLRWLAASSGTGGTTLTGRLNVPGGGVSTSGVLRLTTRLLTGGSGSSSTSTSVLYSCGGVGVSPSPSPSTTAAAPRPSDQPVEPLLGVAMATALPSEGPSTRMTTSALALSGASDSVVIAKTSATKVGGRDFSVGVSVRVKAWSSTPVLIADKDTSSAVAAGWALFLGRDSRVFATLADGTRAVQLASVRAIADGQWHAVVLVVARAGGTATLYVDGVQQQQTALGSLRPLSNSLTRISVGKDSRLAGPAHSLTFLKDVRLWDAALSAAEAAAVTAQCRGASVAQSKLVVHLPLLEGAGLLTSNAGRASGKATVSSVGLWQRAVCTV
jgi:hypothetical protein